MLVNAIILPILQIFNYLINSVTYPTITTNMMKEIIKILRTKITIKI